MVGQNTIHLLPSVSKIKKSPNRKNQRIYEKFTIIIIKRKEMRDLKESFFQSKLLNYDYYYFFHHCILRIEFLEKIDREKLERF